MFLTLMMILAVVLAALQARLPTLWWLGGQRLDLLPALVACAALMLSRRRAVALALVAGLAHDALSVAPFGITAAAYAAAAFFWASNQHVMDRDLPWVQLATGGSIAAASSILACLVVGLSWVGLVKIVIGVCLTAVLTPILMLLLELARMEILEQ